MFLEVQRFFLYGRTYFVVLFSSVNVGCGPAEERVLLTGLHAVSDIYCECCKTTLGWKYVSIVKEIIYRLLNCKKTLAREIHSLASEWRPLRFDVSKSIYDYLRWWTTTTTQKFYCFYRSMHLRIARNTKKESLLSKWFIWSKTTDGNDLFSMLFLCWTTRRWSSRWKILYSLFVYITRCEL